MNARRFLKLFAVALPILGLYAFVYHLNWGLWPSQNDRLVQSVLADVNKVEFWEPHTHMPIVTLHEVEARHFVESLRFHDSDDGMHEDLMDPHFPCCAFYKNNVKVAQLLFIDPTEYKVFWIVGPKRLAGTDMLMRSRSVHYLGLEQFIGSGRGLRL